MGGSLPPREAWIEIRSTVLLMVIILSLPPREAWIEIPLKIRKGSHIKSRFPRGKRGLKLNERKAYASLERSLPPREAWIEIRLIDSITVCRVVASPAGSVD